jgi:acyl transferase domain-containing protein
MALHHKVLPPSLHCQEPAPALAAEDCPLYVNTTTRPWIHPDRSHPRRAAVSAFGFGGINAHVVLEEWTGTGHATGRA